MPKCGFSTAAESHQPLFKNVLYFTRTRCELASRSTRKMKPTRQIRAGRFGHEYCFIAWYAYEPPKPERQLHHRSVAIELEIGDVCWTYARPISFFWPRRPAVDPNYRLDQPCKLRTRRANPGPGKFGALEQRSLVTARREPSGVAIRRAPAPSRTTERGQSVFDSSFAGSHDVAR